MLGVVLKTRDPTRVVPSPRTLDCRLLRAAPFPANGPRTGRLAASHYFSCRCCFHFAKVQACWCPVEGLARRTASQSEEHSARCRCCARTLQNAQSEEYSESQRQREQRVKGRPPFCNIQCPAHRGTSACCAPRAQCPVNYPESHDLGKIQHSFTT